MQSIYNMLADQNNSVQTDSLKDPSTYQSSAASTLDLEPIQCFRTDHQTATLPLHLDVSLKNLDWFTGDPAQSHANIATHQSQDEPVPSYQHNALVDTLKNATRGVDTKPVVSLAFPQKLYKILTDAEELGFQDIISFLPHGNSFMVWRPSRFVKEIMPIYFRTARISSFNKQLNLYGFKLTLDGSEYGSFSHPNFQKNRPNQLHHLKRKKQRTPGSNVTSDYRNIHNPVNMEPTTTTNTTVTGTMTPFPSPATPTAMELPTQSQLQLQYNTICDLQSRLGEAPVLPSIGDSFFCFNY